MRIVFETEMKGMPSDCRECSLYHIVTACTFSDSHVIRTCANGIGLCDFEMPGRPDWCPLREVEEK